VIAPDGARRTYRLTRYPVHIGSDPSCDVTVVASGQIAGKQVRIDADELTGFPIVYDTAGNGTTQLHGKPIRTHVVEDRDVLTVADISLEFHFGIPDVPVHTPIILEILSGRLKDQLVRLDRAVTIGRRPDNVIPLPQPDLSGQHARFEMIDGVPVVQDMGSRNGTMVNGEKLEARVIRPLRAGDLVDLASLGILVRGERFKGEGLDRREEAPDGPAPVHDPAAHSAAARKRGDSAFVNFDDLSAAMDDDPDDLQPLMTVGNAPVVADDLPSSRRPAPPAAPPQPEPAAEPPRKAEADDFEVDLDALQFDDDD
ncbi:MAG: FHA domain-containing protein, partial [Planctomycetota bacterium]